MPDFRRYYIPNSIVFITCVTKDRAPILTMEPALQLFQQTQQNVKQIHPFDLLAYVSMPDHFHWLMKMPEWNPNFSDVIASFKRNFTYEYKKRMGIDHSMSLWQNRFWDHVIRDERDLERHMDYIHYNPIKHGFVQNANEWKHSSFEIWMDKGYYKTGWEKEVSEMKPSLFGE